ncbi:MAG TPA: hypothetical protein VNZ52_06325 [Candidatus Thermoplasmatota archaeon]|nr:hypothetical protein [Candidatus Thermoplasmatota archaeon]
MLEPRHRFSLGATFLGWCVASFLTLVFVGILAAILGGVGSGAAQAGFTQQEMNTLGIGGLIGLLVCVFLAYLIGGYAAGRIAYFGGAKHGAVVPVWTIIVGILAAVLGGVLGAQFMNAIPFMNLDWGALAGPAIIGLVLTLLVMFAGAIIGGKLGAKGDRGYRGDVRQPYVGGRPL